MVVRLGVTNMFFLCHFPCQFQTMGTGSLTPNPCQEERMFTTKYKSHFPTLKSILGITQIITKAYKVTKFNKLKLF